MIEPDRSERMVHTSSPNPQKRRHSKAVWRL
jgi:hypothetical protein